MEPRCFGVPQHDILRYNLTPVRQLVQTLTDGIAVGAVYALIALGYTLVDRTERTAEGLRLIEKALTLAPEDPFILDSMGWAQFRLGNLGDSEKFLRRALADHPDPEIAAHLGEVLWAKGERDSAQELWQSQLRSNPDNPVLLETVRRLAR